MCNLKIYNQNEQSGFVENSQAFEHFNCFWKMSRNWTLGLLSFKDLPPLEEDQSRSQNLSLRQSLGNLVSRQRHIFSCFECDRRCCYACVKSWSQVINSQRHSFPSTLEKSPQLVLILETLHQCLVKGEEAEALGGWAIGLEIHRLTAVVLRFSPQALEFI